METQKVKFLKIDLESMLRLAKGWLESTPLESDALNHIRFSSLVGDLEKAIRDIEEGLTNG